VTPEPPSLAGRLFATPWLDLLRGQAACLGRARDLLWLALGLAAGWWLYVPAHELLHAAGCLAAGGEVTRLEVSPVYGGAALARVFPFVVAGGEYAGRLSGFDTGGSDFVYLATDLAPFVLTLFPGVWLLRLTARKRLAFPFGASLPFALAPFLSAPGDAYEIGSVIVTRLGPLARPAARELLRGDDVARVALAVEAAGGGPLLWTGLVAAALVGLLWAFLTYGAGGLLAAALGQRPMRPATRGVPAGR